MSTVLFLIFILFIFILYGINANDIENDVTEAEVGISILQNSCIGKPDGYHYLKLADEHTISSLCLSLNICTIMP